MFQTFNTDTLVSRFIKNLIYNTYVPNYKCIVDGDWIVEGCYYVYKNNVIKCERSGFFKNNPKFPKTDYPHLYETQYKVVNNLNKAIGTQQISEKKLCNNAYYDWQTHEALGRYLRFFRSQTGIDLMPFYNCFSNHYSGTFYIKNGGYYEGVNNNVQVAMIPIELNKTYTIAIDSPRTVEILPMVISSGVSLKATYNGQQVDLSDFLKEKYYKEIAFPSFKNPITFGINSLTLQNGQLVEDDILKIIERYSDCLYLIIQMPITTDSSIVVLEGDYTDTSIKYIDYDHINDLTDSEINSIYLSELSLLRINDKNTYAFSDRLLEYLFKNAIDSDESIDGSITYAQYLTGIGIYYNVDVGVWDDRIRYTAYDVYANKHSKNDRLEMIDINGYIDKDIEFLLSKGLENGRIDEI